MRKRFTLAIPASFVDFPAEMSHRLTRRAGFEQGQADVLCPLAWLSAFLSPQELGDDRWTHDCPKTEGSKELN